MNSAYGLGFQRILEGSIAWLTDTIKVQFLDSTHYTPALSTDQFLSDIPGAALVGSPQALASKTTTLGVANAANTTMPALVGSTVKYILIYKDTGVAATSPLICLLDTAAGLPFTPTGGDVVIQWDAGSFKIFQV